MSNSYTITVSKQTLQIEPGSSGSASFTVTNKTGKAMAVRAEAVFVDQGESSWLTIDGEEVRNFSADGTQQYLVKISVPASAASGTYPFKLRAYSVDDPDEYFAESSVVEVTVPKIEAPAQKKSILIPVIAVVVVFVAIIVGGILYLTKNEPPTAVIRMEIEGRIVPLMEIEEMTGPLYVDFDAGDSTDPEGKPLSSYTWQIDGHNINYDQRFRHEFTEPGTYEVTLTVTDASGVESAPVLRKIRLLSPPVTLTEKDSDGEVTIPLEETLEITLDGNRSTGFKWEVVAIDPGILRPEKPEYRTFSPESEVLGGGEKSIIPFTTLSEGQTRLKLGYRRVWEQEPVKTFTVLVTVIEIKWHEVEGMTAKDIGVGADGTVWIIGTDEVGGDYGIHQWDEDRGIWEKIGGGAIWIDVDPSGNPWVVNVKGEIFRRSGESWRQLPGTAKDIGVGADGTVWHIGAGKKPDGYGDIYWWDGNTWSSIEGAAIRIDVDPSGNPWIVNDKDKIFRRSGESWQPLPGVAAKDIGVGADGTVWIIGTDKAPDGDGIYWWAGNTWHKFDGGGEQIPVDPQRISVDPQGKPWVVSSQGTIFKPH